MTGPLFRKVLRVLLGVDSKTPAVMVDRKPLTLEEIRTRFYADVGIGAEDFSALWMDVADTFRVDARLIRPEDRLGVELPCRVSFGASDEDIILSGCLKKRMRERRMTGEVPRLRKVDEYIRFLAEVPVAQPRRT